MKKHFYFIILFVTVFYFQGFSQALPPVINSYADSAGSVSAQIFIAYTANDTGTIKLQVQLQKGTGNNVYDSTATFRAPANDTGYFQLTIDSLVPCTNYQVLVNMANNLMQGPVINPLFTFTTLCNTGIVSLNENSYSLIASGQNIQVKTGQLPQNGNIEIYDLTGRLVLTTPFTQLLQQIPFNQNAGLYLLRITGNQQVLYTNRFAIY
jgi:hypothetical protein